MSGFSIQCTTCRRSLRVVSPEAIGQILACPKCGSMVLVEAPAGWNAATANQSQLAFDKAPENKDKGNATPQTTAAGSSAIAPNSAKAPQTPLLNLESSTSHLVEMLGQTQGAAAPAPALKSSSAEKQSPWKSPPVKIAAEKQAPLPAIPSAVDLQQAADGTAYHPWPKWFWPGIAAIVAAAGLILAIRLIAHGNSENAPLPVAVEPAPESSPKISSAGSDSAVQPSAKQSAPDAANREADQPTIAGNVAATTAETNSSTARPATSAAKSSIVANDEKKNPAVDSGSAMSVTATPGPSAADKPPLAADSNGAVAKNSQPEAKSPPPLPQPAAAQEVPVPAKTAADLSAPKPNDAAAIAAASPESPKANPADRPQAQGTLRRVPPRMVNVEARLSGAIEGMEVSKSPLSDYLNLISDLTTIPITLDCDAPLNLGHSPAEPISVRLNDSTAAGAIKAALDPLGLGYQVRSGQLIVGYPPQQNLRQVRYAVADLTGNDPKALGDLAALVRRMVEPKTWQQAGGQASLVAGSGTLVVDQNESAHAQILTFCEKLRVARGLPLKSRLDPARFVLNTREDKAQELLNRPLTANFLAPQPLSGVIKWLQQATGVSFVIDHAALAADGISDESDCSGVAVNKALSALLDNLTASAELTWRAIDEKTIEITTLAGAANQMDVEFYPAADLAADAPASKLLISQIQLKLDPKCWSDAPDKATIDYDAPSKALIVRAPQRLQARVEAFLADSRAQHKK